MSVASGDSEMSVEQIFELVSALPFSGQLRIAEQILRGFRKGDVGPMQKSKKAKKAKKERDPDAPKKEPSEWIKHTSHCRQFLPKEAKGVPCTQVASMLKKDGKMFPEEADVLAAFESWKAAKSVDAEAEEEAEESVVEDSVEESVVEEVVAPIAEPVKAKKTKKAAAIEAAVPVVEVAVPVIEVVKAKPTKEQKQKPKEVAKEQKPKEVKKPKKDAKSKSKKSKKDEGQGQEQEGEAWEHDFGSGSVTYDRFKGDEEDTWYIFHPTTGFMGLWNETDMELDTTVADPTA